MKNAEQGTAEQTAQHQRLLAEVSRVLAATLDYPTGLTYLVRLLVPDLPDWYVIDMVAEYGVMYRLAIAHADAAKEEVAHQLQCRYPILHPQATHTIMKVLCTVRRGLILRCPLGAICRGGAGRRASVVEAGLLREEAKDGPLAENLPPCGPIYTCCTRWP